jgi:hypothetical protein
MSQQFLLFQEKFKINVANIFYFFESSKSMSSSIEAKPNINEVNIIYKISQLGLKQPWKLPGGPE